MPPFCRGKPSCHKKFGEANAILAGDALLNQAFILCADCALKGERFALAAKLLADFAGANGMICGQAADLYYTEKDGELSEEELEDCFLKVAGDAPLSRKDTDAWHIRQQARWLS